MTDLSEWTQDDKKIFLFALRKHGDSNLFLLQSRLPHKTIVEIRSMIDHYKKLAQIKWLKKENKSDEIRNWIDIIEKINLKKKGCVQDIIPRVLKYIALFEKKNDQSDIDLSAAYCFLSEISYASSTKELSERTGYFVYQCLVRLAENLQQQDIEEILICLKQLENFKEILKQPDESMLNPLGVPENLLQVSSADYSDITPS